MFRHRSARFGSEQCGFKAHPMAGRGNPCPTRINRALREMGCSFSLRVSPCGANLRLEARLPRGPQASTAVLLLDVACRQSAGPPRSIKGWSRWLIQTGQACCREKLEREQPMLLAEQLLPIDVGVAQQWGQLLAEAGSSLGAINSLLAATV